MASNGKFILAIDPGVTCTGIVFVKKDKKGKLSLVDFSYISEPQNMKGESECARVFDLASKITATSLEMFSNHTGRYGWSLAIEYVYYNRLNPKSLILQSRLLQAIETMMVLALNDNSDFTIHEYNPNTVKSIVYKGKATKNEIRESVKKKVHISKGVMESLNELSKMASEAIYDATAVAYTHSVVEDRE